MMKQKFLQHLLMSLVLVLFFDSCSKENDPSPTSTTIGSSPNAKFLGTWNISEHGTQSGSSTYNVTIVDSTNTTYILFAGLYGFHAKTKATTSINSIFIPSQIIDGTNVSGSGTLTSSARITLTYYVNDGLTKDTLTSVLTK
jgi:hypothetical protein